MKIFGQSKLGNVGYIKEKRDPFYVRGGTDLAVERHDKAFVTTSLSP